MDNSLLKELAAARRRRESERGEQSPKRPRVSGDQASNASNDNEVIDLMASDDDTRLHGTIGESEGDYGEHHLLPLCDRLRQHSAGGGGLSFVGLNNVGGDPPSAVVDAATIAARLNGP